MRQTTSCWSLSVKAFAVFPSIPLLYCLNSFPTLLLSWCYTYLNLNWTILHATMGRFKNNMLVDCNHFNNSVMNLKVCFLFLWIPSGIFCHLGHIYILSRLFILWYNILWCCIFIKCTGSLDVKHYTCSLLRKSRILDKYKHWFEKL